MEGKSNEILRDRPTPVTSKNKSQESGLQEGKSNAVNPNGNSKGFPSSLKNEEIKDLVDDANKIKDESPENSSISPSSTLTDVAKSSAGKSTVTRYNKI